MFIYNVTTKVDWSIAAEWVQWMKEEHIPRVMATDKFERHQLLKLLEVDDVEGPTYAVQYFAVSKVQYNAYIELYSAALRKELIEKWGENFISFRTLMEVVD